MSPKNIIVARRPQRALVAACLIMASAVSGAEPAPEWKSGKTRPVGTAKVTLSHPVLVGRSSGYLWFPTVAKLADGRLMATMSNYADVNTSTSTSSVAWSADGGKSWSPLASAQYGDVNLRLPNGDELFLPYYMRPAGGGVMSAPYQICPKGKSELKLMTDGVKVTGWPRPDQSFDAKLGLSGFVFNGQAVALKDGRYLATLYGHFEKTKRYALVAAESTDGMNWKIRTTIADENCAVKGVEGPCEAALCRLADGRLMCVFRLAAGVPFGQTYSADEGRTWSEPLTMDKVFSVQPSLAVLPSGAVALSGGRPGIFLWLNLDGTGKDWLPVDLLGNHNEYQEEESIQAAGNTSAYTETIVLDPTHLLVIYDRIPFSWSPIPKDSRETNSVWVVRVTVE